MNKFKSEKGGITVFVIVALLFIMAILIGVFWKSTNYQVAVLQAEQRIKAVYGNDVNNVDEIYASYNVDIEVGAAQKGNTTYDTLAEAIADVKDSNQVTITLLSDVTENVTISNTQNIILNLRNHTINNNIDGAVITNAGILQISGGTIQSTATSAATINNTGTMTINSVTVSMKGVAGKQAIYNDKSGTLLIKGNSNISSVSAIRAAVHNNAATSSLTITGGTITSTGYSAVKNDGIMTIGTWDGNANVNSLLLKGSTYGIESSQTFNYYDGTIEGITDVFNFSNEEYIGKKEAAHSIEYGEIVENSKTYKTAHLLLTGTVYTVAFDANGGSVDESSITAEADTAIGTLPTPTRLGYIFTGWYTLAENGVQITEEEIITSDMTYYAHWQYATARIGANGYTSLQAAINAVPTNGIPTTIVLQENTSGAFTVAKNKNIIFDLGNFTISNTSSTSVITNNGTISIQNGTIQMTSTNAAINNENGGSITVTGGRIISTGGKASIYNKVGTVEISGNAYLSSNASGRVDGMERGTVQNLAGGTATITGGEIIDTVGAAVSNNGTLTIGIKSDGTINTALPSITGKTYGVKNNSGKTFNFYDGVLKGETKAYDGTVTAYEPNTQEASTTEGTYKTVYLVSTQ